MFFPFFIQLKDFIKFFKTVFYKKRTEFIQIRLSFIFIIKFLA